MAGVQFYNFGRRKSPLVLTSFSRARLPSSRRPSATAPSRLNSARAPFPARLGRSTVRSSLREYALLFSLESIRKSAERHKFLLLMFSRPLSLLRATFSSFRALFDASERPLVSPRGLLLSRVWSYRLSGSSAAHQRDGARDDLAREHEPRGLCADLLGRHARLWASRW